MRLILASLIVTIAMQSATAQLFSPESMNGALLGMFIGGAVGSDHHCEWSGEGAAIGAGVGFVTGALLGEARRRQDEPPSPDCYPAPPVPAPADPYSAAAPVVTCAPAPERPQSVAWARPRIPDAPRVPDAPTF